MVEIKYPTWYFDIPYPTSATELFICDKCGTAQWCTPIVRIGTQNVHYCMCTITKENKTYTRMRKATNKERNIAIDAIEKVSGVSAQKPIKR